MPMQIIIDGYNLIHAWGWMPTKQHPGSLSRGRQRMFSRLAEFIPADARNQVAIIFDAGHWYPVGEKLSQQTSRSESCWGFDVRFADQYDEADSMIEDLIRQSSNPDQLLVISSDHRLIQAAQRRKAQSVRSQDCLDKLELIFAIPSGRFDTVDLHPDSEDRRIKEQLEQNLKDIDWMAEFQIQTDNQPPATDDKADQHSNNRDIRKTYNPFPPGYGEDLL